MLIGLVLLATGLVTDTLGVIGLGVLSLVVAWSSSLWSRRGLDGVHYERHLARDRAVWGDSIDLCVSVENRKLLPLAWLSADDHVTAETVVRGTDLVPTDRPGLAVLRNTWSLAPYQQVIRRFSVDATRRGRHVFGDVRLSVADLFGRGVATREETMPETLLVRPRTVVVRHAGTSLMPLGHRAATRALVEDPALFAGVRPYHPGDPRRRIHQRASARLSRPVSKRFEPSTAQTAMIALDIQTQDGPFWLLHYEEDLVEGLIVAAGSLARQLLEQGTACGLAINAWNYTLAWEVILAPASGQAHMARILDLLARASDTPSRPFDSLLAKLPARLPRGAYLFTLGARDPVDIVPPARRLRASGFEVRHIAFGPDASRHAARARRLGLDAVAGHLDPDWRTSDALALVA